MSIARRLHADVRTTVFLPRGRHQSLCETRMGSAIACSGSPLVQRIGHTYCSNITDKYSEKMNLKQHFDTLMAVVKASIKLGAIKPKPEIDRRQGVPYNNGLRDARRSRETGVKLDNPYRENSRHWKQWNEGFERANRDKI
ncbi:hypothetical protein FHS21_002556 [Phyllobacterium trifolii]|uniref:Uncharacterized protein n=1 Tax=Phyllobacterium trifolii TaxID=300193 RepID=A0A839UBT3_9HYPH|nr:hypothetical protein [Phyllobacterium trifolii]MBB3146141.1 hypothetical protein [Phyllobacterium trifolii]